jgi:hypothetical protein
MVSTCNTDMGGTQIVAGKYSVREATQREILFDVELLMNRKYTT